MPLSLSFQRWFLEVCSFCTPYRKVQSGILRMERPRGESDIGNDRRNSNGSLEKSVLSSAVRKSWRKKNSKINLMIVNKHPIVRVLSSPCFQTYRSTPCIRPGHLLPHSLSLGRTRSRSPSSRSVADAKATPDVPPPHLHSSPQCCCSR